MEDAGAYSTKSIRLYGGDASAKDQPEADGSTAIKRNGRGTK